MQYEYIVASCRCRDPRVVGNDKDTTPYCSSYSTIKCAANITDNFYQIMKTNDSCIQMCPLECMSILYPSEISTSSYPSDYYADILRTQPKFRSKYNMNYQLSSQISAQNSSSANSSGCAFNPPPVAPRSARSFPILRAGSAVPTGPPSTTTPQASRSVSQTSGFNNPSTAGSSGSLSSLASNSVSQTNNTNNSSNVSPSGGTSSQQTSPPTTSSVSPCLDERNPACVDVIKATILKVSVFYSELSYTYIEDSPEITTDTLVGVVGKKNIKFSSMSL
jgi:hypothetical protein